MLLAATVVALVLANSPWSEAYQSFWHTSFSIEAGPLSLTLDLQELVNDGLMAVFFFVVGLEIKRELVEGELRERAGGAAGHRRRRGDGGSRRHLSADQRRRPRRTRLGNPHGDRHRDGCRGAQLLGSRVRPSLKLFVLALAIVDDIGAILVIALFYSGGVRIAPLVGAAGMVAVVLVMRAVGVQAIPAYVVAGVVVWLFLHEAGIHPTITGVIFGLLAPTRPARRSDMIDESELTDLSSPQAARQTAAAARQSVSVVEWLEHGLHPWTSFLILPLFALANAGVPLNADALTVAVGSPITIGIVLGLVVGKTVGITAFAWLAVRTRAGEMPDGATWPSITGVAAIAGIGFTVAIFIAGLAFEDLGLQDLGKIGILVGSLLAAVIGVLLLRLSGPARTGPPPGN